VDGIAQDLGYPHPRAAKGLTLAVLGARNRGSVNAGKLG
jgi:hypothetical protein